MKKPTIFNSVLAGAGLALSLLLAVGGSAIETSCGVRTPGTLAAQALVRPRPQDFGAIGDMLRTQMFVDWIFWFAALWLLYFIVTRISQRLKVRP